MSSEGLEMIALARIMKSRWQPRGCKFDGEMLWELARSIQENGLINSVVVFPVQIAEDDPVPWFELVAGERRVRAMAGLALGAALDQHTPKDYVARVATVGLNGLGEQERRVLAESGADILARVIYIEGDDLGRLHRMAVVENIERASLMPLEEARALEGLADAEGWTQRELARKIGKSQSYVAQRLALLELTSEAQEAVSTRVLTATHARAIARVPEVLQPAVTAWAVEAVGRNDVPATTRQVQNRARQLAAFVDPTRWEPNGERVYEPAQRNRLALIRWVLEQADLETCGESLLKLAAEGYSKNNWLAKKPVDLVESGYGFGAVLEALGKNNHVGKAWDEFAIETGRLCDDCVFGGTSMVEQNEFHGHCQRWRDPGHETCLEFIGDGDEITPGDPVVIPLTRDLASYFVEDLGVEVMEEGPFGYVTSVTDYVVVFQAAVELKRERIAAQKAQEARSHIIEIERFRAWQLEQPAEVLGHFQSHTCAKCVHRRDQLLEQGLPPCLFAVEPLKHLFRDQLSAPEFGVLVAHDGRMFPRCEMFAYRETPDISPSAGAQFATRLQAMSWLHGMVWGRHGSTFHMLWGILRWLDYGRPEGRTTDFDKLQRWIVKHWDSLGGDVAVATLLDVVKSEVQARGGRKEIRALVNPVTREMENFVPVDFAIASGEKQWLGWMSWPEGWPRPWVDVDQEQA